MRKRARAALAVVLILLVVLVGLVCVLGVVAPTDFNVEREVVINRPRDVVFDDLRLLKNQDAWSPWMKRDPNVRREFRGTDGTVGFVAAWSGNDEVGVGEEEIKSISPGRRIDYELRFTKPMEDTSDAYLITEPAGESRTRVRWGMKGKSPFPRNVICLLLNVRKKIGADFEQGLAGLKARLEK
jgi:uncharacterized protein YndB with AHSA1/START domain